MIHRLELETSWGVLRLEGGSRAADGTVILLPQLKVALDAGRPLKRLPSMKTVWLSHGHVDHAGCLPWWAAQRALSRLPGGRVLTSASIATQVEALLESAAVLAADGPFAVEVQGVEVGKCVEIGRGMELEGLKVDHRVPAIGALLRWHRRQLLPQLQGSSGDELKAMRQRGEAIDRELSVDLLAYLGDTGPAGLTEPALSAEILIAECTYSRDDLRSRAEKWGHLHLSHFIDAAQRLKCRHLVLLHASRRESLKEIATRTHEAFSNLESAPTVHLMNVDWD